MVKICGKNFAKNQIIRSVGNLYQVAGVRELEFKNGLMHGVKAVEVKNGSGLNFKVLLDRCMDIADADYQGKPIAWISKNGLIAPQYYENGGPGFLRSFSGGLITTCGLTQAGNPCVDGDEILGIHGRISHIPVEKHNVDEYWNEDELVIRLSGQARESCLYRENLVLKREIVCSSAAPAIHVSDEIINEGFNESPFMILYHVNFGFPIVSSSSRLYSSADLVEPWNSDAKNGDGEYSRFCDPVPGYLFQCFTHHMPMDQEKVAVALINEELDYGGYISYSPRQMPCFNEWKMMGEQDYVVGFEPGINIPEGRIEARNNNRLHTLKPGEKYDIKYEIGILNDRKAIDEFLLRMERRSR